ncbi:MAG TPA: neutral zinc metallopeptidase [Gemmatimonadaceae bacterium]|nr:neutral zinc metallopeptidase [Gemmatimonadaceae bacterium]
MRWTPGGVSRNIEDRRGARMGGGMKMGLGGTVVLLILSLVFGQDFISGGGSVPAGSEVTRSAPGDVAGPVAETPEERERVQFVSFVLDSAQSTWSRLLPQATGVPYRDARLVLFRDAVQSACGMAPAAAGPFYCPLDERVYIDLSFYDELAQRFGAPGDFAQAYVLAHEIGHHVQHVLGINEQVSRAQQANPRQANDLSVRLELQADCLAGVWGHSAQGLLEPGDVEEGLTAAAAIGDDRIQRQQTGTVNTDKFTHGSSAQRVEWLRRGLQTGDPNACDTF